MLREVVEKEGGEAFTDEDEEILVLFASQAATAIANARTYRADRRARADLEALIETSPVGVVVFDVGTGRPVSLNREARRIVEGLRNPGQSAEQLLEVITYRRAIPEPIVLGDLAIDYDRRRVTVAGREVELTATEYELLRALSLNAGRVTTSETLLNRVWSARPRFCVRTLLLVAVRQSPGAVPADLRISRFFREQVQELPALMLGFPHLFRQLFLHRSHDLDDVLAPFEAILQVAPESRHLVVT